MDNLRQSRPNGQDFFSRMLGMGSQQQQPSVQRAGAPEHDMFSKIVGTAPAAPPLPNNIAEPDASGFFGGVKQMVRGKQDPRFADTGTVFDQFRSELHNPTANAATFGASDEQMADIMQKTLGDKFVRREKDANGYDVFVTRGPDGQEQRGYVNKPGLDGQDIARGIRGALPYAATGGTAGVAARGAGVLVNAAVQGVTAGATSAAGDAAQIPMGSEQGIELGKAGINTAAGVAGPVVAKMGGALWRRFVTEPSLFDRSTGVLTDKGAQIAREAGFDPSQMAADIQREFGKTYARTAGDASAAAAVIADKEFNIPSTIGQRMKDGEQLLQEKAARFGVYGGPAKEVMSGFDKRQADAVHAAALTGADDAQGIVRTIAPGRTESELGLDNLGREIRGGMLSAQGSAQAGERAAWDKVTDITPKPEAFATLPDMIAGRLGDLPVDDTVTPVAASMAKALDGYVTGKAIGKPVADVLKQSPVTTLDQMRRRLLAMRGGAQNDTDRKASGALYDAFNDWIDDAAEKAMINGNPEAAANLRIARDATKTLRQIFAPSNARGFTTPGGKILDDVLQRSDSAEGIVSGLFGGGPSSNIKDGSVEALKQMRAGLQKYADKDTATKTWNDVRAAYWVRLVKGKDGKMFEPGAMLTNVSRALNNQRSLVHVLYENSEIAQMVRFQRALKQITYKDPNPSNSAIGVASLSRQFFSKVLNAVPFARALVEMSPIPNAYGTAVAKRAVSNAPSPPQNALMTPYLQAGGSALNGGPEPDGLRGGIGPRYDEYGRLRPGQ